MLTKLTAALVREVTTETAPSCDTSYFDIVVPRFALRVKPPRPKRPDKWAALYFVRYTGPDGFERRLKVGDPATTTLEDARRAARAHPRHCRPRRRPGGRQSNPSPAMDCRRGGRGLYRQPAIRPPHRESSRLRRGEATLRLHARHRLGRLPLADIDVAAARRLMHAVETTRGTMPVKAARGLGAARKTARVLSALLSWCADEKQLSGNPLIGRLRVEGDGERSTVVLTGVSIRKQSPKTGTPWRFKSETLPRARGAWTPASSTSMVLSAD